ncbi:DUF362 domain-containing protein [candidate division KSB1 bacterium]|nr:DUF362 domain-containing protein [candidate division KSB1 bacterium]
MAPEKSIVSMTSCDNYEYPTIQKALRSILSELPQIDSLVKSGQHVHVKPNMLTAKEPERAATTHPAVVRAVVEYIQQADIKITIGDSPAGISKPIEHYWEKTGLKEVADKTGASLIPLEKKGVVERRINNKSYYIAQAIADADVVINVCKLKTHGLTLMTGAIKNMFGTIPGVQKGEFHKIAPKLRDFANVLVDVFQSVRPALTVMDAIVGMEGSGPSSGTPKKFGYLLAGHDAVAIDTVASHIMGFNPHEIITSVIAAERGLGCNDIENIDIRNIDRLQIHSVDTELPSNRILYYTPEFLIKLVGKLVWIRPRANKERCRRCGVCIHNCPVQAMNDEDGLPIIDYNVCIKCFCCDESCPHQAIEQEMSWLARKLR